MRIDSKALDKLTSNLRRKLSLATPLDMTDVVRKLGFKVEPDESVSTCTELLKSDSSLIIKYDPTISKRFLQFSIASKLGAYIFTEYYKYSDQYVRLLADEFAARLLVPSQELFEYVLDNDTELVSLRELSDHFNVSIKVVDLRGQILKLWN